MTELRPTDNDESGLEKPNSHSPNKSSRRVAGMAIKTFADSQGQQNRIITGEHSKIARDFVIEPGRTVGRNSVVGPGCRSSSSIGQFVQLGREVSVEGGCTIGIPSMRKISDDRRIPISQHTEHNPTIIIGDGVEIANGVIIHNGTQIGNRVTVGKKAVIGRQIKGAGITVIGDGVEIGEDVIIEAGVCVGTGYRILQETVLSSGVVLKDRDPRREDTMGVDEKYLRENGYYYNSRKRRS